jgi:hypothetical protein
MAADPVSDMLNTANMGNMLASGMNEAVFWIMLLVGIAVFIGVVWFVIWFNSFKIKILIREVISGRNVIIQDMAREWYDDKGVLWWIRRGSQKKEKKYIPVPDTVCIDTLEKGTLFAEFYYINGQYVPVTSTLVMTEGEKRNFKPLTTTQRTLLVNNVRSAEQRRGKNLLDQLPTLVSIGALVLIVICLLVFYGNIAEPVIEARQIGLQNAQINAQIVTELKQINGDLQVFKSNIVQAVGSTSTPNNGKVPN